MTPTPSPHTNFADSFRFGRNRRQQRNADPYDGAHNVTPSQPHMHTQQPVSPHIDEGLTHDSSDEHVELEEDGEMENDEVDGELEEEGNELEEEEGEGEVEEDIIRSVPGRGQILRFTNIQPVDPIADAHGDLRRSAGRDISRHGHERPSWQQVLQYAEPADRNTNAVPMEIEAPFDPTGLGLKEIGNLASWTVSSCKPGCGVEALRSDDTNLFWQSDGPQPHHLNIHFSRLVSILSIRIFLDFEADESYTPTRIKLLAGTGYHDLIQFFELNIGQPKGWIDINLNGVGGGEDGRTLRAFLLQLKVMENHQNGKDTHIRGLKVYARDERATRSGLGVLDKKKRVVKKEIETAPLGDGAWLVEPDWMGEPELR